MSQLADNLAAAWEARANREAKIDRLWGFALTKPEEFDRSMADFRRAVEFYRYWTGIGAA